MLTADELGEKGESRFKEWCADSGLICNKADRDRAGWDFIVDDSFEDAPHTSLDKRDAPMSCHLQVKTIGVRGTSVRMKLNMAERLTKELKPTFICVLKVDSERNVVAMYLIHLLDDRLAYVLRRLREHSVKPTPQPPMNSISLTFTPTSREQIACTGAALRLALQAACGKDLPSYVAAKQVQLKKIGYGERPIEMSIAIDNQDATYLGDVYLGLRPSVPITNMEVHERRFDIPIPQHLSSSGTLSFQPTAAAHCRAIVRSYDDTPPVALDMEVFPVPTRFTRGPQRIYFKGSLLCIDLIEQNGKGWKGTFSPVVPATASTLNTWTSYGRLVRILASGELSIEIQSRLFKEPVIIPAQQKPDPPTLERVDRLLSLLESLSHILHMAGLDNDHCFSIVEIERAESQVELAAQLIRNRDMSIKIPLEGSSVMQEQLTAPALLCHLIQFGDSALAYHHRVSLSVQRLDTGIDCTLSAPQFRRAQWIKNTEADFAKYREQVQQTEGIKTICHFSADAQLIS